MKLKKILLSFLTFCLFITSSFLIVPNSVNAETNCDLSKTININSSLTLEYYSNNYSKFKNKLNEFLGKNSLGSSYVINLTNSMITIYTSIEYYRIDWNYGSVQYLFTFENEYGITENSIDLRQSDSFSLIYANNTINTNKPASLKTGNQKIYKDENGITQTRDEIACLTFNGSAHSASSVLHAIAGIDEPVVPPEYEFSKGNFACEYVYKSDNKLAVTTSYHNYVTHAVPPGVNTTGRPVASNGGFNSDPSLNVGTAINTTVNSVVHGVQNVYGWVAERILSLKVANDVHNQIETMGSNYLNYFFGSNQIANEQASAQFNGGGGGSSTGGGAGRVTKDDLCKLPGQCTTVNTAQIVNCWDLDSQTWQPVGEFIVEDSTDKPPRDNINYITQGNEQVKNDEIIEIQPKTIQVSNDGINLHVGESKPLFYNITPVNATNKFVTWSSNDITIADVVDGFITGYKVGETQVTVTTENGISKSVFVNVYADEVELPPDKEPEENDPGTGGSIWDFLSAIVNAISNLISSITNGFTSLLNGILSFFKPLVDGLMKIIDWLLNLVDNVLAALPGLLIPSADFMSNLKDIELPKLADNFGFLYQPITVINDSLTQLSNMSSGDGVISYGAMNDPFYGVEIIPAGSLDLTSMINTPGISELYQIYKLFINASFLLMFINFAYKKFISLLGGN